MIERTAPGTAVIDITHQIPRHDIRTGALSLWRTAPWLVPGVILGIVDPGVGTDRRAIAIETEHAVLIGPDNGLLLPAALRLGPITTAVTLTGPRNTFAGRDVFAPAAARVAAGEPVNGLGEAIDPASIAGEAVPDPVPDGSRLQAEVLWVDRFGNAQLNASPSHLTPSSLTTGGATYDVRTVYAYGELEPGEIGLVVDSYGLLSVCLCRDSAVARLGLRPGDHVLLSP